MKLGVKHTNQSNIVFSNFTGGLNTSSNIDGLAENQLAYAVNVEVDTVHGRLKTVAGTVDLLNFKNIFAAIYDDINGILLIIDAAKKVYVANLNNYTVSESIGTLSGSLYPTATLWEDGVLIASGDKLQYFNGKKLITIDSSPICTSVYVRAGRVLVTDENNLWYSGVGDETNWTEDSNDDSSAKFIEIGYKDGGKLFTMINLSDDVLLIKNNRRVYRLSGEYPSWSVSEVSRNVEVRNRLGVCSVADSVFILGQNEVQNIQTTADYGDMKPVNIATLIMKDVQSLPKDTKLRYIPALNQIWAIAGKNVLVYDVAVQAWFKRRFNTEVVDVISVGDEVLVIKTDRVSKLYSRSFYDSGESLHWWFQFKRLLSYNDFFLKRVQVSYVPLDRRLSLGEIHVGKVTVCLPDIYDKTVRRKYVISPGALIYGNKEPIFSNPMPIFNRPTILVESRNVYRHKFLDIKGTGHSGGILFSEFILTVAEV